MPPLLRIQRALVLGPILGACWLSAPVAAQASADLEQAAAKAPDSLILLIPDGFGPASRTLARSLAGHALHLDTILVGSVATGASDSLVTDSAAAATAYACGIKTYNGAIAVGPEGQKLETLLEAAERRGMATGMVSTARITHATPAAFSAHVPSRGMEAEIAAQQIEQGIEVILGGGAQFFLPRAEGGLRQDGRDLLTQAAQGGVQIVRDSTGLREAQALPLLGLFTSSHMAYEIDRDARVEPSLAEMTERAITLLAAQSEERGFFLLIEGGRIDHAGHAGDPAAHARDVLAFDEAVGTALAFARLAQDTLLVAVADHETGGLSLGRNDGDQPVYAWRPDFLRGVRASIEGMLAEVAGGASPRQALAEKAGVEDLTQEEEAELEAALALGSRQRPVALARAFSRVLSRRALTGWTTWGHTGVDVELFAFGPGSEGLRGHHENDALGRALAELLGLASAAAQEAVIGR